MNSGRILFAATLLVLAACGDRMELPTAVGGGDPIDPSATFTRVQNEIFTPSCAALGCHDPLGQQSQLVLTPGNAWGNIVNVPAVEMPQLKRVDPASLNDSYLYRKIIGVGITGERMPLGGPPLPDAKVRLVRDWIRRGAPND